MQRRSRRHQWRIEIDLVKDDILVSETLLQGRCFPAVAL